MEKLYSADNLHISYDPETRIMFCKWVGYQPMGVIQYCGAVIIRLLKEKQVEKILNDNTEVSGPWIETAHWTASEWFPEIIQAGLKHFAWVLSSNIFAELSAIEAMPASNVVVTFYSVFEAQKWLMAQSSEQRGIVFTGAWFILLPLPGLLAKTVNLV
jgi:hypothetical protein